MAWQGLGNNSQVKLSFLFCNWVGYIAFQENADAIQENAIANSDLDWQSAENRERKKRRIQGLKERSHLKRKVRRGGREEVRWEVREKKDREPRTIQGSQVHKRPARISGGVFSESVTTLCTFGDSFDSSFFCFFSGIDSNSYWVELVQVNLRYNINSCNSCSSLSSGDVQRNSIEVTPRQSQSIYKQPQE